MFFLQGHLYLTEFFDQLNPALVRTFVERGAIRIPLGCPMKHSPEPVVLRPNYTLESPGNLNITAGVGGVEQGAVVSTVILTLIWHRELQTSPIVRHCLVCDHADFVHLLHSSIIVDGKANVLCQSKSPVLTLSGPLTHVHFACLHFLKD